jgi:hypothetical protein
VLVSVLLAAQYRCVPVNSNVRAHKRMVALEAFPLDTAEDIRRFERCLDDYMSLKTNGGGVAHFSLAEAFGELQGDPDGPRIFAALIDVRISLALLFCDSIALGREANKTMPQALERVGKLTESQAFEIRMEMHRYANSFILRFRSLWDKFMGLLVLRFAPQDYERFASSKSKKAAFRKIMAHHSILPDGFVSTAEGLIQKFDDSHRTPEAHGTGTLRKKSFAWNSHTESPPMALLGYWNFMNEVAHVLGECLIRARGSASLLLGKESRMRPNKSIDTDVLSAGFASLLSAGHLQR